nr:FAD binding domain-containing protein [uncultured Halomonas sp.]
MQNFAYARAQSSDSAVAAAAQGAMLIAGGTEFLNWMRLGIARTDRVMDISRLEALRGISMEEGMLRIGALATLNEIESSQAVRDNAPVLSQACLKAASAQLRNRATIGGNVLQKTRCPYFRAEAANPDRLPWPCNKRAPGSGCAALEGYYSRAALFGTTASCVANQPSDPAVALAALDAVAEVVGPNGPRDIPMTRFHLSQEEAREVARTGEAVAIQGKPLPEAEGAESLLENRLHADELIIAYRVPVDAASRHSFYLKVRERESYEYAMTSAAVCLEMKDDAIAATRIALGSVAQKPWRLTNAEAVLAGKPLGAQSLDSALDHSMSSAKALPGQEYKITLARNTARRALQHAGGHTHG